MPIPFKGFDERGDVTIYERGVLPHWRQAGCTYFVTFRLADSLPQSAISELEDARHRWLLGQGIDPIQRDWKRMLARLPVEAKHEYERQVGDELNRRLDEGYGSCTLRESDCRQIVGDALTHFHGERVWIGDYVIMPNHVHVLMTPMPGFELESILRSVKGFSARECNRALAGSGTFWQRESYDHIVRDLDQLERFQNYIGANPSKARLPESS